jgi:hypothetical protein
MQTMCKQLVNSIAGAKPLVMTNDQVTKLYGLLGRR